MKNIGTFWDTSRNILTTSFQGDVTLKDVAAWKLSLWDSIKALPTGTRFKLVLDLRGFAPVDIDTHKAMRNIIPEVLAQHGLRPAFIDLFDEKPEMAISIRDDVQCIAFANIHHDETKMADYRKRIGRNNQQFFTDLSEAQEWIRGL